MSKFKGYRKTNTSDKVMRIVKRERILSIVMTQGIFEKVEGGKKGLTRLTLNSCGNDYEYHLWKINRIIETNWFPPTDIQAEDGIIKAIWEDSRKIRIYSDWLKKSGRFTYEKVLKYMYSPFFPAVLVMDNGYLSEGYLYIDLNISYGESAELLSQWFQDIFEIRSTVVASFKKHELMFDLNETKRLLEIIEPIVQEVPGKYKEFYLSSEELRQG